MWICVCIGLAGDIFWSAFLLSGNNWRFTRSSSCVCLLILIFFLLIFPKFCMNVNSMEQSPSWGRRCWDSQLPCMLWNLKIHYWVRESTTGPYPESTWMQSTPSHPFSLKIHFNINLPSMHTSSMLYLFLQFSHQYPVGISLLIYACHIPSTSHPVWTSHTFLFPAVSHKSMTVIQTCEV